MRCLSSDQPLCRPTARVVLAVPFGLQLSKPTGEDNPDKVDLEGHHEILASAWTMLLQMEMLLHLNKKDQNNDEITVTAEKHLAWISDKILAKKQSTTFTSYIIKSAVMFCSNMVTMNICNSTLANLAAQLSSDFLDQGMKIN